MDDFHISALLKHIALLRHDWKVQTKFYATLKKADFT